MVTSAVSIRGSCREDAPSHWQLPDVDVGMYRGMHRGGLGWAGLGGTAMINPNTLWNHSELRGPRQAF